MHVVQVLVSLNLGGSELVAVELTEFLAATGHRVTVVAADGPLGERVRATGAEHLDWPVGRKRPGTLRYIGAFASGSRQSGRTSCTCTHGCPRGLPGWHCVAPNARGRRSSPACTAITR